MLKAVQETVKSERAYESVMRSFGEILERDSNLQKKLNEVVDKDGFAKIYVELAAEKGYEFTVNQMFTAMQEQKQGSNWVLPRCAQSIMREL